MAMKLKNGETITDYANLIAFSSTYGQGWLHQRDGFDHPVVTASRTVRGIDEDRARSSLDVFVCSADEKLLRISSQSLDVAKPVLFDMSPSGTSTIGLHNSFYGATGAKEEKFMIEITRNSGSSYRVDASNVHGGFMGDTWFGGCSWSADERFVAYVAAIKVEKPQTYFGSQSYGVEGAVNASSTKYNYQEEWGEKFVGVGALGLFVLDTITQQIHKVSEIDNTAWTVGQPCLIEDNCQVGTRYLLAYTAFSNLPRKLGLFSCYQRPTKIFYTDLTALLIPESLDESAKVSGTVTLRHQLLSVGLKTARSARCSPESTRVVFLGHEQGFEEHNGCSELFGVRVTELIQMIDSPVHAVKAWRKLVSEVASPAEPSAVTGGWHGQGQEFGFPGLYLDGLPPRCFEDETKLCFSSQWGSNTVIVRVTIVEDGSAQVKEALPGTQGSRAVLDVRAHLALYVVSTPISPPRLEVVDLRTGKVVWRQKAAVEQAARLTRSTAAGLPDNLPLGQVACNPHFNPALQSVHGLNWEIFSHTAEGVPFQSILIHPNQYHPTAHKTLAGIPLVLVPHGGPHSCMPTSYFHAYAYLAYTLGAAVLHVNYRGSPGFGQNSIHSLAGKVGSNDVADMMAALALAQRLRYDPSTGTVVLPEAGSVAVAVAGKGDAGLGPLVGAEKVAVVGGSHGGFLAGHLIGQFPSVFKAAAMRNPVTNIPAMYSVSDIPDWCVLEACGVGAYNFDTFLPASESQLLTMRRASPIHYVAQVVTPTLVCLGGKDKRVPPSQGWEYHHVLKAQGVPTRLMVFPEDNHPIDRPASEAEHWLAIADWISTHLHL